MSDRTTFDSPHADTPDTAHELRITRTTLSDGRELIYFDDTAGARGRDYVTGAATRKLDDDRGLPQTHTASEMRRDPLTGHWYVYAAHRNNRTFMPPANENPLAPSRPGELPTEIPADDYDVVVFENRFPSLSQRIELADADARLVDGQPLFPREPALGRCEVVCFTPESTKSFRELSFTRARTVVEAWAHRTRELSALPGIKLVYPFENRGEEIGVTLQHPHGQIYSYPYLPPHAAEIAASAQAYRATHGENADLFDAILTAEREAGTRIITAGEHFTAFVPAAAKWPVEVMVMAHRAVANFAELTDAEKDELTRIYLDLLDRLDRYFEGVDKTPYIASWNQSPVDAPADGRFHLQLFSMMRSPGRMKFLAGSESGQGAWISDTTPERIADRLRELAPTAPVAGAKATISSETNSEVNWVSTRTQSEGATDAAELFEDTFGGQPTGVWSAPGRVNLIGEHVDYAGGVSLPFALSQRTFVAARRNGTGVHHLVSEFDGEKVRAEVSIDRIGPGAPADWTGYAVGTVWAAVASGVIPDPGGDAGLDMALVSDVPVGAGLSSSAALECSVGLAAADLYESDSTKAEVDRAGLMAAAIRAENEVVGASTGGLDQRISLFAETGHALAIDFLTDTARPVPFDISEAGLAILVINTNAPHVLADGQYESRRAVIDGVTADLEVDSLRQLSAAEAEDRSARWADANPLAAAESVGADAPGTDNAVWRETVARRVHHVVTEIDRTLGAIDSLERGDFEAFGAAMYASHASLRDDYEVTVPELDMAVEVAREYGALGARMTGGGFGGSAIALLSTDRVDTAAVAIAEAFAQRGFRAPEFAVALPAGAATRER